MRNWTPVVVMLSLAAILGGSGTALGTPPEKTLRITAISADSVGIGRPSVISVAVLANYELTDVTASIVKGEGFEIESQVCKVTQLMKVGDTSLFTGVVTPLETGTWRARVRVTGTRTFDRSPVEVADDFYIYVSDTLARLYSADEWLRLNGPLDRLRRSPHQILPKTKKETKPPEKKGQQPGMPPRQHKPNDDSPSSRSGTFNVVGYLEFHDPRDEQDIYRPAKYVIIDLWDDDADIPPFSDDDWLGSTMTDGWGYFALYSLSNDDCIGCGTADPYVAAWAENSSWTVETESGVVYRWVSETEHNVADYVTEDFGVLQIAEGSTNEGAMWCYQYLNDGWQVIAEVGPYPDLVRCHWDTSFSTSFEYDGEIYIQREDADAIDIVNHEYAHALMNQSYVTWPIDCDPGQHFIYVPYCSALAWTEGWADFFPLVVVPDGKFDSEPYGDSFELENNSSQNFQHGPAVEGRVAAALLDLWDIDDDSLDQNSDYPVSFETIYTWGIQYHRDSTFQQFWQYIRDNELSYPQSYRGTRSIKNNTITGSGFAGRMSGDCNADNSVDIADASYIIAFIFSGGAAPVPYLLVGDVQCDGDTIIADAVYIISYIYSGGAVPCTFE